MKYYIGIDLGTSAVKGILLSESGEIVRSHSVSYPVITPQNGWTEQNPHEWLRATLEILSVLSAGIQDDIAGMSFGGQMHGLVVLDENDNVIRPCILWNDGRTQNETDYLNREIGRDKLSRLTGNIAFAGFTVPKLLWMERNEPDLFLKIAKIMLPKDYIVYMLTGVFSTDFSDASGTLLLDVEKKCWSSEMCRICHVRPQMLPNLYESYDVVGKVKPQYGLKNCIVTAGAGDNAAAAIGTGTVKDGNCNISLGTSGTVFIARDCFSVDPKNALHSFAHASGKWHLMGCILSAASARKWWLENILESDDYGTNEAEITGCRTDGLYFLPYLSGERSPHNDTDARGAFIGLSHSVTKAQMSRAVMEGVAFALRDCVDVARTGGTVLSSATLCGGGAKSRAWRQILADVLNIPIMIPKTEQGPAMGAAILAMVGDGIFSTLEEASESIVAVSERIVPVPDAVKEYERKYQTYKILYPALKSCFPML